MTTRLYISSLLLTGFTLTGCLKDEPVQLSFTGIAPVEQGDGWQVSTPSAEGFDVQALDNVYRELFDESLYPNIRSLLIVKNGKLVGEAYFKDEGDLGRMHAVMSVTKSITSLVAGIAIERGWIGSIDDPVRDYLPEYFDDDPLRQSMTIRHLLTMESGLDFDNESQTGEMFYCGGSSLEYVLSRPMAFAPGTDWYYGDGNPQLISGIVQRTSGMSMEEVAAGNLFGPLGIRDYYWEKHRDGLSMGGMGLWLLPRDMARIGQLMLNGGSWNGKQLISEVWVKASTVQQASNRDYGYYWLTSEGVTYWASGKGGQLIWMYPDQQLVVVITSDSFAKTWSLSKGSYDAIFQGIVDAIAW